MKNQELEKAYIAAYRAAKGLGIFTPAVCRKLAMDYAMKKVALQK
jgi:hypothetical protein